MPTLKTPTISKLRKVANGMIGLIEIAGEKRSTLSPTLTASLSASVCPRIKPQRESRKPSKLPATKKLSIIETDVSLSRSIPFTSTPLLPSVLAITPITSTTGAVAITIGCSLAVFSAICQSSALKFSSV